MSLYPHQQKLIDQALPILKQSNWVALVCSPRTGKTRVAISLASEWDRVLVLTKKNAIVGWLDELSVMKPKSKFYVTNYEQAKKLSADDYDFVILDEAHKCSKIGKPSQIAIKTKKLTNGKPVVILTATPNSEQNGQWFQILWVANKGPFLQYGNFYSWFKVFGIPNKIKLYGKEIETYKAYKNDKITVMIKPNCLPLTQLEANPDFRVATEHVIEYRDPAVIALCATLKRKQVLEVRGLDVTAESGSSLLLKMHQLVGGTVKQSWDVLDANNNPKRVSDSRIVSTKRAELVEEKFSHLSKVVVFTNYIAERELLMAYLGDNATEDYLEFRDGDAKFFVGNIKAWAEGVSFKFADAIVMYSINFSATTWIQARDRLCSNDRVQDAPVCVLLCEGGIDRYVYKAVSKKHDFTLDFYRSVSR